LPFCGVPRTSKSRRGRKGFVGGRVPGKKTKRGCERGDGGGQLPGIIPSFSRTARRCKANDRLRWGGALLRGKRGEGSFMKAKMEKFGISGGGDET